MSPERSEVLRLPPTADGKPKLSEGRPPGGGACLSGKKPTCFRQPENGQTGALTGGLAPPASKARLRKKSPPSAKPKTQTPRQGPAMPENPTSREAYIIQARRTSEIANCQLLIADCYAKPYNSKALRVFLGHCPQTTPDIRTLSADLQTPSDAAYTPPLRHHEMRQSRCIPQGALYTP